MSDRIDLEDAYVLHAYPYRETSLIVEMFTRHHGRLPLVARGARRAMSSIKSRLLAFQPLQISWFGKGAMRTLHDAEWLGGSQRLEGRAMMSGFYLNELLLKLLPAEDAHDPLFARYEVTLAALACDAEAEPVLRRFELDLLSDLGYAQTLTHLADGGEIAPEGRYRFTFDHGLEAAQPNVAAYSGKTLQDMAAGDFSDPRTLAEGKQLMRTLINHYLGDKPLLTRQLLRDLQAL